MNIQKVTVFCGSSTGFSSVYQENAEELGVFLVKNKISLLYGGGKLGLMGTLADSVLEQGGKVIGVIPDLLHREEVVHPKIHEVIVPKTMSERKVLMSKMTDAYIIMPGGLGTLDELFEVLTLQQLQIEQKPVGLLNVNGFFNAMLEQLDFMVKEGFLKQQGRELLIVASTVEDLMEKLLVYESPEKSAIINKIVK